VKAIASLASLRVSLEEAYQSAVELRPVIEALFSKEPLTPEQMQQATDKTFAKTLIKFAEAKAAHDKFLPVAQQAWEVVAPSLPEAAANNKHLPIEPEPQAAPKASEERPDTPKNGQKTKS
ncbi:MAG: hypothetical protein LDL41_21760, partial [Coleofasciculus sp. S288]|nr:hypothetical protein [Coleofasciculus sp. S288]